MNVPVYSITSRTYVNFCELLENFCERGNSPCFPYVNRAETESGKQCVFQKLTAFPVVENKGKMPVFNCKPLVNVKFYTAKTSVNTGKRDIRQVLTDR